jgi:glycosyltransferase involved in cell wall biosynthesis
MKVLLVASTFPSSDTDAAPAFVKDLVIALHRTHPELHIDVLAPQFRDQTPPLVARPHYDEHRFAYAFPKRLQQLAGRGIVPAIEHNKALIGLVPLLFAGETLALLQRVRAERPDVIYAHWFTPQGVTAAVVSALTGVPWVLTSHANVVRVWGKLPVVGRHVVRALLPTASRLTAVSGTTLAKMRAFFSDEKWAPIAEKTAVIPMGVDVGALAPSSTPAGVLKERHGLAGKRVVYFVGRLAEKKGVPFLLEAFARLGDVDDAVLVIAGDGHLKPELEAHAARLALGERVRFVGYVTGARKSELLQLADVVAVPSIEAASGDSEGFPVVIMEALAAGRVCVASDATGADDVLRDGESGFVVPQKDSVALATALRRGLSLDDDARARLGERARQAAAALDWPGIAERHFAHLLQPFG